MNATLKQACEKECKDAKQQNAVLRTKHTKLDCERLTLIQAHYAGVIPLDLLRSEQERICREMEQIEAKIEATEGDFDAIAANLDRALDLAANVEHVYLQASETVRNSHDA